MISDMSAQNRCARRMLCKVEVMQSLVLCAWRGATSFTSGRVSLYFMLAAPELDRHFALAFSDSSLPYNDDTFVRSISVLDDTAISNDDNQEQHPETIT